MQFGADVFVGIKNRKCDDRQRIQKQEEVNKQLKTETTARAMRQIIEGKDKINTWRWLNDTMSH